MPNPTPTGPIAVAVEGVRTLIASLAYFQTWTGTANATDALAHIFAGETGIPVVSYSIASGIATFTTRRPHGLTTGQTVTLEGASLGKQSQITPALTGQAESITVLTPTTFSYSVACPDTAPTSTDFAYVLPCARPIVVVSEANDPLRSTTVGTGGASVMSGVVDVLVEADVSTAYANDATLAPMEARNLAGQLVQAMIQNSGTGDLMYLNGVEMVSFDFIAAGEQDDNTSRFERWRALLRVQWGLEG